MLEADLSSNKTQLMAIKERESQLTEKYDQLKVKFD